MSSVDYGGFLFVVVGGSTEIDHLYFCGDGDTIGRTVPCSVCGFFVVCKKDILEGKKQRNRSDHYCVVAFNDKYNSNTTCLRTSGFRSV